MKMTGKWLLPPLLAVLVGCTSMKQVEPQKTLLEDFLDTQRTTPGCNAGDARITHTVRELFGDQWLDEPTRARLAGLPADSKADSMQSLKIAVRGRIRYPTQAKLQKDSGVVGIWLLIGADGRVLNTHVVCSRSSLLDAEAVRVLSKVRIQITPATGMSPLPAVAYQMVDFSLD